MVYKLTKKYVHRAISVSSVFMFLYAFDAHAFPSPERIEQIRQTVSLLDIEGLLAGVEVRANAKIPAPAVSYAMGAGSFLIQYNPDIFLSLSRSAKDFVMFHELGHIRLGHVSLAYPGPEAAKELELEADTFAVFTFEKFKRGTDAELREFFALIKTMEHTVPRGSERVALCEALMATTSTAYSVQSEF